MMKRGNKRDRIDILYEVVSFVRFGAICALIILVFVSFIAKHEVVRGTSMYPQLKDGERVFINVAASYMKKIERFDVVVVKNHKTKELWVKRVIGLPGEIVTYKDDQLYIDGRAVKETFLDKKFVKERVREKRAKNFTSDYESNRLKKDEYLLLGDNRLDSLDSRSFYVGPFKKDQIIANGVFVITPLSEMRYVSHVGK